MKYLLIVLLALLSSSCSDTYDVDPAFQHYVWIFEQESKIHGTHEITVTNLIMKFAPDLDYIIPGKRVDGYCKAALFGNAGMFDTPTIFISAKYWPGMDSDIRMELMLHEMGHCVLGRVHDTDKNSDNNPVSIMYPSVFVIDDDHRAALMTEYFNPTRFKTNGSH